MFRKILGDFASKIRKIPKTILFVAIALLLFIAYGVTFLLPRSVAFSYSEPTCRTQVTILPDIQRSNSSEFLVTYKNTLKIGSVGLASTKICFEPEKTPQTGTRQASTSPFGWWVFKTNYAIHVGAAPQVVGSIASKPIAITKPLAFTIDQPDSVFDYAIKAYDKTQPCDTTHETLRCMIDKLGLTQGVDHPMELIRSFNDEHVVTVSKVTVSILPAVAVIAWSIPNGQTVYDKPTSMTITLDKTLKSATAKLELVESTAATQVATTTTTSGAVTTIQFNDELAREKSYRATLVSAEAADGSTVAEPYTVSFNTSGGPKVSGINIGTSGIDTNAKIIVTFDQPLARSVNIAQYATINGASAVVNKQGAQVIFSLQNAPRCAALSLSIAKGVRSEQNGLMSIDDWSYNTHVNCRTTSVIGYSVKGRPITAYYYGNGSKTILFTSGMHGSESSGYTTMQAWATHLDTNAPNIPAGTQVVIVPNTNPDGIAAGSRYNANGVNIDRNFPTADWKTDIQVTGGGIKAGGGGSAALSEPETRAIADLTGQLRPRAEVSFHAQGRLVGANLSADSVNIGNIYASTVGYATMYENTEEIMGYELTGEYETWMGEQLGVPAILIELPSAGGNYFASQQAALWKMVNL